MARSSAAPAPKQARRLFPSLQGYRKSWLPRDLIAGITIAAIAIPGQIAVAKVAGMPPTTGLWACVAAGLFGAFLLSNRVLWVGSDSTTAPLILAGLSALAATGTEEYTRLAVTLALSVGLIFIVVAVAKLDWLADLLSRPVIAGFMTGIATIIVVGQLPSLLGIPPAGEHTLTKLWNVLTHLNEINWVAATIGIASLILLPLFARINKKLPGALLVMAIATLATALLALTRFHVEVLGPLQTGPPHVVWPALSLDAIRGVLPTAFAIAMLSIAQTAATSRSSADANGFSTSLRSDFAGVGLANIASGGVGAYSVDASPGATVVMASSGARTQLAAMIGALLVLAVVLFGGTLLADLPNATLAAIMILLSLRIVNVKELRRIRAYAGGAWALTIVTFAGVVILGVEAGVVIAVAIALMARAVRTGRPEIITLGRRPDGHWLPADHDGARKPHDMLVLRLNGPLWFANANWYHDEIKAEIEAHPDVTKVIIDTVVIDDVDYTGASVMTDVVLWLEDQGVQVAMAEIPGRAEDALRRIRISKALPPGRVFPSTEDAYQALLKVDSSTSSLPAGEPH